MIVWKIIMFVLCLNVVSMAISNFTWINYSVPSAINTSINIDTVVTGWNPVFNIPIIGDIVTGVRLFFDVFKGVVTGFPDLLDQIGVDKTLTNGIRALMISVLAISFIQLISGRMVED